MRSWTVYDGRVLVRVATSNGIPNKVYANMVDTIGRRA